MSTPYHLSDDAPISTNQRTLIWLLATAVTLATTFTFAWASVKGTAEAADKKATEALIAATTDHDVIVRSTSRIEELNRTLDRMDKKLDRRLDGKPSRGFSVGGSSEN